ncbi:hypothetical protein ACWD6I_20370, partial [Streptomyces sp. NPDC002454]
MNAQGPTGRPHPAGTTGQGGTPGTPRVLRTMNDRAALDLLLARGPLSRTHLPSKPNAADRPATSR